MHMWRDLRGVDNLWPFQWNIADKICLMLWLELPVSTVLFKEK